MVRKEQPTEETQSVTTGDVATIGSGPMRSSLATTDRATPAAGRGTTGDTESIADFLNRNPEVEVEGEIRFTRDGALVVRGQFYDTDALLSIDSFDAALSLVQQQLGGIVSAETLGDGFAVLSKNKDVLCGVPVLFMSWDFNAGDFGEFVSVRAIARREGGALTKVILNDGSTGIYKQLRDFTKQTGKLGGLVARQGLRRSDYDYDDGSGQLKPASTYYIDTTA
jgi:hypothetical protein